VLTGMQRIAARSRRSPTWSPAREAGDSSSVSNGPWTSVDQAVGVGRQAERPERPHDPGEVGDDHRERVEREQRQNGASEPIPSVRPAHQPPAIPFAFAAAATNFCVWAKASLSGLAVAGSEISAQRAASVSGVRSATSR
jgi:hypothetical protein